MEIISFLTPFVAPFAPLLIAAAPIVVKWATNKVKSLEAVKFSDDKTPILRFAAGVMSLGAAVVHVWAFGGSIDEGLVSSLAQTAAETVAFYWGASGIYHISKSKGNEVTQ